MNTIELNAILYYADYLSLQKVGYPVTDNCKYFFIHNTPVNSAYIVNLQPIFDTNNQFFIDATQQYIILRDKFGDEGVMSFLENISQLKYRGVVDAKQMLKYIHRHSSKLERQQAYTSYYNWLNNQKYIHTVRNDEGELEQQPCSRYVKHFERSIER